MLSQIRIAASWLRGRPRLGPLALRLVPDVRIRLRYPNLGTFRIRLRRNRSFWLRDPEQFEQIPFSMLKALVRPGDIVADIGANLGLYSRFIAGWTGASRVLAFEPWVENRELLHENLALGSVQGRVQVLPFALADVEGELEFQVDDAQSASGALDLVRKGSPSEGRANLRLPPLTTRVPCRTLDGLVERREIAAPAVLKIDVEGAEARVLAGACRLLSDVRPRVFVELHGADEAKEVLGLLLSHGYKVVGRVVPSIDPAGFVRLGSEDLSRIRGRYDVAFMAAVADGEVPQPLSSEALFDRARPLGG